MSLGLHAKCLERLRAVLSEALSDAKIVKNYFLDADNGFFRAERVLPKTGELRTNLEEFIGESPVFMFAGDQLTRRLEETQKHDPMADVASLATIDGYTDPSALAASLVQDFESLPWSYSLMIGLPQRLSELFVATIKQFDLSDSITLVSPDKNYRDKFPLTSPGKKDAGGLLAALRGISSFGWDTKLAYLQIRFKGYNGKYFTTQALDNALSMIQAFYGLGLAIRLFKIERTHEPFPLPMPFIVHRKIGDSWQFERSSELEAAQSQVITDLALDDGGRPREGQEWENRLRGLLQRMSLVFSTVQSSRSILLASQWLFQSRVGKDELLSFVQAAVVMEVLLGDKAVSDLTGLGELLANRCAFLISNSHVQREKILRDFRAIYDVRSKIVHRGKRRLNYQERYLFERLQWMCRRVIQREIELRAADQ